MCNYSVAILQERLAIKLFNAITKDSPVNSIQITFSIIMWGEGMVVCVINIIVRNIVMILSYIKDVCTEYFLFCCCCVCFGFVLNYIKAKFRCNVISL